MISVVDATIVAKTILPRLLVGATTSAKGLLTRWNLVKGLPRLSRVELVKPIWNPGRETSLHEFYYPCLVQVGTHKIRVSDLNDLDAQRVLITGHVGQGKSILLRFLASNELRSFTAGDTSAPIPLFLELRHLGASGALREFVIESLNELGLDCDVSLFEHLANNKHLALLLDGFDEMPVKRRKKTLLDLDRMSVRYPDITFVVTSRPNVSGIEHLPGFVTRPLLALDHETRAGFIRKQYATDQQAIADRLIKDLKGRQIGELVTTPLMSALLVIHYNAYQKLPEDTGAFHEDLFDALLRRHDATKPGFVRSRKSKMDDLVFRSWFDRFAFHAMKSGAASWSRLEMLTLAGQGLPPQGTAASAEDVLDDALHITGLVVAETTEYRFLHKSIMEYHAASCVRRLSDTNARRFYRSMSRVGTWRWWDQVLDFLSSIDRLRYLKHFEIGQLRGAVSAPSVYGLLAPCNPVFQRDRRILLLHQDPWLFHYDRARSSKLLDAVATFFGQHAEDLTYDLLGERTLTKADLVRSEGSPLVASRLDALLNSYHAAIESRSAEVERLDDAEELLDMDGDVDMPEGDSVDIAEDDDIG